MDLAFSCLVRFKDPEGNIHYGDVASAEDLVGTTATILEGHDPWSLTRTDQKASIAEILCPLPTVPLIYGIGGNYRSHIEEASAQIPEHPIVFTKSTDALAGPYDNIIIDSRCLEMDYEGELVVVIGKDLKNFSKGDDPLDYILGYTVGNDLSSRYWFHQQRGGRQHSTAKSYDKFAPIGPVIVSSKSPLVADKIEDGIPNLNLQTRVNGNLRQNANTRDLLMRMSRILEFLTMGRTVRKGTIIMTGTPSGVALFMKPAPWLQSGDIVGIAIENLGGITNKMMIK